MSKAVKTKDLAEWVALVKGRYQEHMHAPEPQNSAKMDLDIADLLKRQILDSAHPQYGGWGDVTEAASPALSWTFTSLGQLGRLAEAWGAPQSRYFKDAELAHRISLAAKFYATVLTPAEPFPGNWWGWQIGMPRELCRIFLAAGEAMELDARKALLAAFRHITDHIWDFHASSNRMETAMSILAYALIAGDASYFETVKSWAELSSETVKDPQRDPQGFRRDGSYFYHGARVNLAYGIGHLSEFARATQMLADTPWRLGGEGMDNCVRTLLDFTQWALNGAKLDPFILDRGIAAPGNDKGIVGIARGLLDTGLLLADAGAPRRTELRAFCVRLLKQGVKPASRVTERLAMAYAGEDAEELNGARCFSDAEYGAVRRPCWTASVKMATTRTCAYAGINRMNRMGWHISDGQLILRTTGGEFDESVFPTMDWERLTGITRADGFRIPHETMGHSWFSAGAQAADGLTACCGLDFSIRRPDDQCEIAARKNWFFLEDAIVATGSNIWTTASVELETVIRHVVLPKELEETPFEEGELEVEFVVGHDGVYILPDKPRILIYTEWREGNYADIGDPCHTDKQYRRRYWTALLPHGAGPHQCWGNPKTDGQYAIIYLPTMTLEKAKEWWSRKPIDILQKDVLAHRLYDRRRDQTLTVRQWKGASVVQGREA